MTTPPDLPPDLPPDADAAAVGQADARRPRIVLVSSCDALADIALEGLFAPGSGPDLAGVVVTRMKPGTRRRIISAARREGALYYIAYMWAEMTLPRLRRGRAPDSVLAGARASAVPVHTTTSVNDAETAGWIAGRSPDCVLSVRPGVIFRQRLIDAVPPILNLHCSMLPEFRGIAGVLRALAAGRDRLGCTVHRIEDEQVDRGDIAAQTTVERTSGRSVYFHTLRLYGRGPETLRTAVGRVVSGDSLLPNEGGSYFSWPDRTALRALHDRGHRLVEARDLKL